MYARLARAGVVFLASLALAWTASAGDGKRRQMVETVDHKDPYAGTITLAGTTYRIDEESKLTGQRGERIRIRELVANSDAAGDAHSVRVRAERSGSEWRIVALEVLGFDDEE